MTLGFEIAAIRVQNRGFTLVELLVVLAIVGVLTVAAYPSYRRHVLRTELVKVKGAMFGLAGDLEEFYLREHSYRDAPWQDWLSRYGRIGRYDLRIELRSHDYRILAVSDGLEGSSGLVLEQDGRRSCLPASVGNCWD